MLSFGKKGWKVRNTDRKSKKKTATLYTVNNARVCFRELLIDVDKANSSGSGRDDGK